GEPRRHEDHRHVGSGGRHRARHVAEHGQPHVTEVDLLAGLAGGDPTDHRGAGGQHPPGVPGPLGAGHALHDAPRVLGRPDRHVPPTAPAGAAASSAALAAAPSIVSTCSTSGLPARDRISRPAAALLPSSRTTSGLVTRSPRCASNSSACTMPLATSSQAVIPPKTLTNTALTSGSDSTISRPLAITEALAPPPMSRKLAGRTPPRDSPAYATTSSVDITSPAPLRTTPTEPRSSLT